MYIVPFVRVCRDRGSEDAQRYKASKESIAGYVSRGIPQHGPEVTDDDRKADWFMVAWLRGITRGDVDNITKTFLDALQGVLWDNDRQVKLAVVVPERDRVLPHRMIFGSLAYNVPDE